MRVFDLLYTPVQHRDQELNKYQKDDFEMQIDKIGSVLAGMAKICFIGMVVAQTGIKMGWW